MSPLFRTTILLLLLSHLIKDEVHCSMITNQKIYQNLLGDFMCFRRFNATHQFGCQSKQGGSVGTIHLIKTTDDIEYVLKKGLNDPYIPCIYSRYFTVENILKFRDSGRVNGLVLFDTQDNQDLPDSLTEDRQCPNEFSSYYKDDSTYDHCKKQEWNQFASIKSLNELDLEFPIILLRDPTNITNIEKCHENFNLKTSENQLPNRNTDLICSIEIKTWMLGAKSSKLCKARGASGYNFEAVKYCDSMNSFNLFTSLFDYRIDSPIAKRSVIMLTSKIDSLSIFDSAATGASTTLTAMITLLAVMSLMKEQKVNGVLRDVESDRNVLYSFFDGESFDYIGSGKTAYDLGTNGLRPLKFGSSNKIINLTFYKENLHSAIEINQATSREKFYIHTDPLTRNKADIRTKLDEIINSLKSDKIDNVDQIDLPLPPSSVQQLLAHDNDLPVLVISNHKSNFINPYYNSFMDDSRTIRDSKKVVIDNIIELSKSIAKTLITMIKPKAAASVRLDVDRDLIEKLYHCLIVDSKCKFFEDIRGRVSRLLPHHKTYPLYISTSSDERLQPYHFEYLITLDRLTAYLNGKNKQNITRKEDCDAMNDLDGNSFYEWFKITVDEKSNKTEESCLESTRFYTYALSPVFLQEEPNWSLNYSTWTESVWNSPSVRLFVSASRFQEYITFFIGLFFLVTSFLISKWFSKNADILLVDLVSNVDSPVSM